MTSAKYNQFRQQMMRQNKPDNEKLIHLATLLRTRYNIQVLREPIILFDKNTCKIVKITNSITETEYHSYIIHVPDLLLYINNTTWIMEIDGWIHDHKTHVIEKDKMRNEHYELSGINHIIINELLLLHNLGIHEDRSATVPEIWPEIVKRIKKPLGGIL